MNTHRWYVAAYQADNGNIIPVAEPNSVREYAEQDAKAMRLEPMGIFVAYRDMPDWKRVDQRDAPIDSARLWWFIGAHIQTTRFPTMHQEGYNDALEDLAKWLHDSGY